jgi:hypothetical protein
MFFPIYNLVQFRKFKISCYRVGVTTVCLLSQTGSHRFQMPTVAHLLVTWSKGLWRAPPVADSGSTPASIADLWDPPKPSLSFAYKSDRPVGIFPPFCCFFPFVEVSTAAHSSPVS